MLDDENEFRMLSMYLADPYLPSLGVSPVSSAKSRTSGRKESLRMSECGEVWNGGGGWKRDVERYGDWRMSMNSGGSPARKPTLTASEKEPHDNRLPPIRTIRANNHLRTPPNAQPELKDPIRKSTPSPRRVTFDDNRNVNSPTSLTRPRSLPNSSEWMWETQPLPPLPCEPPRTGDLVRGSSGRKGSPKVRLNRDGLLMRDEVSLSYG